MEKLTYYQICSLAAQGRLKEIPSGYKIIWIGEQPDKKFSANIDGDKIIFTRNSCPVPSKITITGEVTPVIPDPFMTDDEESGYMEYGDVFIPTQFYLTELELFYGESKRESVDNWRRKTLDNMYVGHVNKSDITFDMTIPMNMFDVKIYSAMLCSLHEEDYVAKAELVYDWFEIEYEKTPQND